jgi:hypothetical protein
MRKKSLTSIAFLAGCTIILAVPVAQAQTLDALTRMNTPRVNSSAQNDRLLDLSPGYAKGRIRKECGPITNAHLRASCIDSLVIDEDRRSRYLSEGLTGDSHGTMNPIDRTFHGPEECDPSFGR